MQHRNSQCQDLTVQFHNIPLTGAFCTAVGAYFSLEDDEDNMQKRLVKSRQRSRAASTATGDHMQRKWRLSSSRMDSGSKHPGAVETTARQLFPLQHACAARLICSMLVLRVSSNGHTFE